MPLNLQDKVIRSKPSRSPVLTICLVCAEANEKAALDMEVALEVKNMIEKDPELHGKLSITSRPNGWMAHDCGKELCQRDYSGRM